MASQQKREINKRGGINAPDLDPNLIYMLAGDEDCRLAEMIQKLGERFRSPKNYAAQLLVAAARKNAYSPLVAWLLKHGTTANGPSPKFNALVSACAGGAERNVGLLLAAGADPNSRNGIGRTPMETLRFGVGRAVSAQRKSRIVEDLAKLGARFELTDMCFLEVLNDYAGLGPKSETMLEELMIRYEAERARRIEEEEIYLACGSARLAPPVSPRSL